MASVIAYGRKFTFMQTLSKILLITVVMHMFRIQVSKEQYNMSNNTFAYHRPFCGRFQWVPVPIEKQATKPV